VAGWGWGARWTRFLAWTAVPADLGVVLKNVAAAVFIVSHAEGEFLVAAASEFKAGADGKFSEGNCHKFEFIRRVIFPRFR
jgi:hypothetical protein